jgi:hypothetical protein
MKQIQAKDIWTNGEVKVGEYFQVIGIQDNYDTYASNYWSVYTKVLDADGIEVAGEKIADGNLSITGQSYQDWGNQPAAEINEWIYDWSAAQLNLVLA